jgi:hypothetical protein
MHVTRSRNNWCFENKHIVDCEEMGMPGHRCITKIVDVDGNIDVREIETG